MQRDLSWRPPNMSMKTSRLHSCPLSSKSGPAYTTCHHLTVVSHKIRPPFPSPKTFISFLPERDKFENLTKSFFLCKEDRKLTKTLFYIRAVYYTLCCKKIIGHHALLLRSYSNSRSVACTGTFSDLPTKAHNGLCCVWEPRPPSHWDPIYQWFIMTA